ncbi:MAG: hypothetical protein WBO84_00040 [Acidimicrobiia bacterium]
MEVFLRRVLVVTLLAGVAASCGGGELSMSDYTERVAVVVDRASQQYEALVASPQGAVLIAKPEQIESFSPQDLQTALEQVRQIEAEVEESIAAIDPPDQVAQFHHLFFRFGEGFISAQEALAARAGTAADWDELSESPEMGAYRAALAQDRQDCFDFRSQLNTIAEQRGDLSETPWIPSDLKEVFSVFLGCDGYPAHPDDVYRPAPDSAS